MKFKYIFLNASSSLFAAHTIPEGFYESNLGLAVWVQGYAFRQSTPLLDETLADALAGAVKGKARLAELSTLNGSYCSILIDFENKELHLVSDRWATRPLYYSRINKAILVGTDYWKIAESVNSTISVRGIVDMLSFGYVLGESTILNQISEVSRASHIVIKYAPDSIKVVEEGPYWVYDIRPEFRNSKKMILELADLLNIVGKRCAALLRLARIERIGVNLTAGFDSRTIAYMLHSNNVGFHCFTSRTIGMENDGAFRVSGALNVPHSFVPYWLEHGLPVDENIFWVWAPTTVLFGNHTLNLAAFGPWPVEGFIAGHYGDPVTGRQAKVSDYLASVKGRNVLNKRFVKNQVVFEPLQFRRLLKRPYNDCAESGVRFYQSICQQAEVTHDLGMITRIDGEQRQRRYILRDYLGLCMLGHSMLPFSDYDLWDFFEKVPFKWQIGSAGYATALQEHVFNGRYAALKNIPVNGRQLRRIRYPIWNRVYKTALNVLNNRFPRSSRSGGGQRRQPERAYSNPKEELYSLLPQMETWFDIDEVRNLLDSSYSTNFTLHNFWALYTIARVVSRIGRSGVDRTDKG